MIPLVKIKGALIDVLKELYPSGYKFYGIEVTEGYEKPSFFVQLIPVSSETQSKRIKSRAFICAVTYFQKKANETDALEKVSEIEKAFGCKVKIEDRYANVTDFEFEYIGRDNNILQARITFSFNDSTDQEEEAHDYVSGAEFRMTEGG